MSSWKETISQTVGTERIADIAAYVEEEDPSGKSPIDSFYEETQAVFSVATPNAFTNNKWIGSLYVIAIISSTENYFREIFGKIIKLCPVSKKNAANNSINFGSVIWHPHNELERGAFEHISLASSESIIKTTRQFVGSDLKKNNLTAILSEFDKICELRHGIVHSNRILAGKNGIRLKLKPSQKLTRINIQYSQLQEVSSVCTTLVISFNQLMFETLSKRWATTWRDPDWTIERENSSFKNLYNTFHSKTDHDNGMIPNACTWIKCRNLVKKEFNL